MLCATCLLGLAYDHNLQLSCFISKDSHIVSKQLFGIVVCGKNRIPPRRLGHVNKFHCPPKRWLKFRLYEHLSHILYRSKPHVPSRTTHTTCRHKTINGDNNYMSHIMYDMKPCVPLRATHKSCGHIVIRDYEHPSHIFYDSKPRPGMKINPSQNLLGSKPWLRVMITHHINF
jgi:hypothetical protein